MLSITIVSLTNYLKNFNRTFDMIDLDMLNTYNDNKYIIYIYYGIYVSILFILVKMYMKYYYKLESQKYKIITIEDSNTYQAIIKEYIDNNLDIFDISKTSIKIYYKNGNVFETYLGKIYFKDNTFKSTGYIEFQQCVKNVKVIDNNKNVNTTEYEYVLIKIYINSKKLFKNKSYITHMKKCNAKKRQATLYVNITYYKFLKSTHISNQVFYATKTILNAENKILYDTYFSQYKYIIDMFLNPSNECKNILCYGKPGVGKSRLAYLCSRFLGCHIYSIDLSLYINNKSQLLKMFNGSAFTYNQMPFTNLFDIDKKCIILLEEIDYAIEKIVENTLHLKKQKENAIMHKESVVVKTTNKSDNSSDIQEDALELSDLLELFQGPIPMPNRYIIANTNNIEKIDNYIPALLRPGRLTKIEFKYITWDILNEITMYYYDRTLTCSPMNIEISTSLIIEDIKKYKNLNKSFEEFEQHLIHLLNT
jgi:hypothetical protein